MEKSGEPTSIAETTPNGSTEQRNEEWAATLLGYRWPASQLSRTDMRQLKLASVQLRRPITQLLKEAVQSYMRVLSREVATQSIMEKLLEDADDDSLTDEEMTP